MGKGVVKLVLIALVGLLVILSGIKIYVLKKNRIDKQTRFLMDTYVTVHIPFTQDNSSEIIDKVLDRMEETARKFNLRDENSPIYKFNEENLYIQDPEILDVVGAALKVSEGSEGAFDITISPLLELWGFYKGTPHRPSARRIEEVLKNVGYDHLVFTEETLKKDNKNVKIDLGAIAKGYVVSQGVSTLKRLGITSAVIDAGGDIYALGRKQGAPWKVGIRMPGENNVLGYVEVEDFSVVGSGNYERFFEEEKKKYHHIFDPRTGYPTEGISGITVMYPDPMIADAWATAFFVLGKDKSLEIVEKIKDLELIVVGDGGDVSYSSGLKERLELVFTSE
ncbi:MAG: FAD:protein FMN transferase [Candidatus Omnitrophica bacterium]|nr:FAD:protein FMN transferase [Candidatus Omnitrophota bacterium]